MKAGTIIKVGDEYFKLIRREVAPMHEEDRGLWLAWKVRWEGNHFGCHDDDDWLLSDDGEVVAREVGWDRKRFVPGDWGFDKYMVWR